MCVCLFLTAAENIKRTWVNYGESRDWFDPLQVRFVHPRPITPLLPLLSSFFVLLSSFFVLLSSFFFLLSSFFFLLSSFFFLFHAHHFAVGWLIVVSRLQGAGEEFFYQAVECKNIWMPMGTIFAN